MTEEERMKYIVEHLEEHPEWLYEDREMEREYEQDNREYD